MIDNKVLSFINGRENMDKEQDIVVRFRYTNNAMLKLKDGFSLIHADYDFIDDSYSLVFLSQSEGGKKTVRVEKDGSYKFVDDYRREVYSTLRFLHSDFDSNVRTFNIDMVSISSFYEYGYDLEPKKIYDVEEVIEYVKNKSSKNLTIKMIEIKIDIDARYKTKRALIRYNTTGDFSVARASEINELEVFYTDAISKKYKTALTALESDVRHLGAFIKKYIKSNNANAIEKFIKSGYFDFDILEGKLHLISPLGIELNYNNDGSIFDILNTTKENLKRAKEIIQLYINNNKYVYKKLFKEITGVNSKIVYDALKHFNRMDLFTYQMELEKIILLVKNRGFNVERLSKYITEEIRDRQGITNPSEGIMLLNDYVNMCVDMGIKYDKYPKSLKLVHDLASMKHKVVLSQKENELFAKRYENVPDTVECNDLVIIKPKAPLDIIEEGQKMGHCVGSYTKKVAAGLCYILFIRDKENINKCLYTVEATPTGNIAQIKGKYNEQVRKEIRQALENPIKKMLENAAV